MVKILNFKVIIEQDEDGVFVASVPAVPGCHTQGDTYEDVLKNAREAIQVCLDEARENNIYREQITWPNYEDQPKFLGIINLPIQVPSFA